MKCRIHKEVIDNFGKKWIIMSSDEDILTDKKWESKPWIPPSLCGTNPTIKEDFEYWRAISSSDLGLINHKKIEHEGQDCYIITSLINIVATNWIGLFGTLKGRTYYEEIKKEGKHDYFGQYWNIISVKDYMIDENIKDNDPSYTEGYKLGCTGLRWL